MMSTIDQSARVETPKSPRVRWSTVLCHAVLIFACMIVLFPLLWVLLLSLKSVPDGYHRYLWPRHFSIPLHEQYHWILTRRPEIFRFFRNSVIATSLTLAMSTSTAVLAGYALVHLRTPGARIIITLIVAAMFFPARVTAIIGIFTVQSRLGLIGHPWALSLPYTATAVGVSIFIMRGVFLTVPRDIVDSSRIDGANSFRALLGIMLPLVRNGIVVVIIVNFVAAWGEYLLAITLSNNASQQTLPVFIVNATGGIGSWLWPRIAALYILAVTPGLLIFAFTQRWYMRGLQDGALRT